ncbi:MAG: hypothetical protein ABIO24_03930, partial [Saprospiraceae bacterium]
MKNFAFKMLLFGLCSMIWATTLSGETGRAMAYPQAVVFQTLDNGRPLAEEQKVKGLMQRNNKEVKLAKRFFQKREGQNGHRGWLILAMVLLYLSVFICVIYGLGSIAIAIGLGGG